MNGDMLSRQHEIEKHSVACKYDDKVFSNLIALDIGLKMYDNWFHQTEFDRWNGVL